MRTAGGRDAEVLEQNAGLIAVAVATVTTGLPLPLWGHIVVLFVLLALLGYQLARLILSRS